MRILFIADGRSPIAINWINHFVDLGHDVHLVTTFASNLSIDIATVTHIPVAFSGLKRESGSSGVIGLFDGSDRIRFRTRVRQLLGPYTLPSSARKLSQIALDLEPDIIHAMRIPFEGMMAAKAFLQAPLVISVWGNDFTLHGSATQKMMSLTKTTLQRCAALHVDCNRDLRLAKTLGFPSERPAVVLPGSGGIIPDIFFPPPEETQIETLTVQGRSLDLQPDATMIVNPRGFRAYIRNDTFFQSIPLILEQRPNTVFLCPAMGGLAEAEKWVSDLGIRQSVRLLPKLNAQEMAAVYRRSKISLSVSEHDGTPNTLLEAMACGCFPIAGDIDSIREWIGDGKNGFLVDPSKPNELADAVTKALEQPGLVSRAREDNFEIIRQRANRSNVMQRAERFYQELI